MATDIEWTDEVWNPVTGCTKVSPGCAHCYAETNAVRLWSKQYPRVEFDTRRDIPPGVLVHPSEPRQFTDVRCHLDRLDRPLRWKKPRKVFVNSMSDLFHEDVPDAFIDRVYAVMALAPQHTFQILTKRAERMRAYIRFERGTRVDRWSRIHRAMNLVRGVDVDRPIGFAGEIGWPIPNVWLGVSVENQRFADERIPLLLQTPAAVRFISAEPLLGATDISNFLTVSDSANHSLGSEHSWTDGEATPIAADTQGPANMEAAAKNAGAIQQEAERLAVRKLDWVIVGGESGLVARPFAEEWARSIIRQCKAAGVACFVKQLGAYSFPVYVTDKDGVFIGGAGGRSRDRKGGDMAEWPADLLVREFPEARR